MGKLTRLIGLLFVVGTTAQAVTFEDIGTVFSTVATVTNNVTTTNDQWRWWCGNLSDGPCIAATVIVGFSILIGGSCSCCLVASGLGIGGLVLLRPCLIPAAKFCIRLPAMSLNAGIRSYNNHVEECELRKIEQQNILLRLKQQRTLEFEKQLVELPKKCAELIVEKLEKQRLLKQQIDVVFAFQY